MNIQAELKESKQQIRSFIRANWSDEKCHDVYCFNADGKMSYFSGCNCLMGVTLSDKLHNRMCEDFRQSISRWDLVTGVYLPQLGNHYSRAHALPDALKTEHAYQELGLGNVSNPDELIRSIDNSVHSLLSDFRRKRRLSAILRAEIKLRARASVPVEVGVLVS